MSIRGFQISLAFVLLFCLSMQAQSDSTKIRSWWLAYKMGRSQANVADFQKWATSEGLTNISSLIGNTLIGFDILYHHNRMVYGINTDIELRTFGQTKPYSFSFTLRAGYTIVQQERFLVKTLGGIGIGYVFVRFENEEPRSIQNLGTNYSDPLARSSLLVSRMEVMCSYMLKNKESNRNSGIHPLLYINLGVTPTLNHGAWYYGEITPDIDGGGNFAGQRIDMPRFYQAQWFATVGIAIAIAKHE